VSLNVYVFMQDQGRSRNTFKRKQFGLLFG
jgi:hypothetical protein